MLIGTQVSIGPLVPDDFGPLFLWANDVAAARLDLGYRPVDLVSHQKWWENIGGDTSKVVFAIRTLNQPTIVGYVQISNINAVHRSADLGIRIGAEANRNKGYGKEALRLALMHCWNHLNLNRVQLLVFKHNSRAINAYQANGFRREGRLRKAAFIEGEWIDLIVMAILRPRASSAAAARRRIRGPDPSRPLPQSSATRMSKTNYRVGCSTNAAQPISPGSAQVIR
jgi:ribosomal-protein-alanine N-acetyltransferase